MDADGRQLPAAGDRKPVRQRLEAAGSTYFLASTMKTPTAILASITILACTTAPVLAAPSVLAQNGDVNRGLKVPTHSPEPLTIAALAGGAALGLAALRRKQKQD
jgi:hypothetical protein